MTVAKAISIVAGFTFLGTLVGTVVGYVLGVFIPDFFTALFPYLTEDANLVQIGLGLGIVNGGLVGIAVGTLVMGIITWYQIRVKQRANN